MRLAAFAAALVLVATARARADSDNGFIGKDAIRLEIDNCPIKPDVDQDHLVALAREHHRRGAVLYEQGEYDGAIAEMAVGYCLLPADTILKDLAAAHERKLHYEQAVAYLERYLLAIPDDAKGADEKRTLSTRIQVLQNLPSQIQVASLPKGALVTFADDAGHRAEGHADDKLIELVAGHYTMTVATAGFETQTKVVDVGIGKPYSFVVTLPQQRGHVRIRTTPADARIFLDDRLVGLGAWEDKVVAGRYLVSVEAPGFVTEKRRVEVAPNGELSLPVQLDEQTSSGRVELVAASGVAGLISGASLGYAIGSKSDVTPTLYAGIGGAAVGLIGSYVGVPDDIPSGTSSYVITSGVIGYIEGAAGTSIFTDSASQPFEVGVVGVLGGATFAALTAQRFDLDAGDAAVLNSGALWGAATGGLFAVVFGQPKRLSGAIVLGGLNAGVITGALLARRYVTSRRHAALVDLSGLAGIAVGVSLESAIDSNRTSSVPPERIAHFALGGMVVGLVAGVYLTRGLDEPKVTPQLTTLTDASGRSVLGFGFNGFF